MEKIAPPILLDPDRPRLASDLSMEDRAAQAPQLDDALHKACDYGRSLWTQLAAVRRYLVVAAPDPQATNPDHSILTAPRGPDDDEGWTAWEQAYAGVTSVLAGPSGDEGFGRYEARREAAARRGARDEATRPAELVAESMKRRASVAASLEAWDEPDQSDPTVVSAEADVSTSASSNNPADGARPAGSGWWGAGYAALAVLTGAFLQWVLSRPRRVQRI